MRSRAARGGKQHPLPQWLVGKGKGELNPRGSRRGGTGGLDNRTLCQLGSPWSRLSCDPRVKSHSAGEMTFWKVPGRK